MHQRFKLIVHYLYIDNLQPIVYLKVKLVDC